MKAPFQREIDSIILGEAEVLASGRHCGVETLSKDLVALVLWKIEFYDLISKGRL